MAEESEYRPRVDRTPADRSAGVLKFRTILVACVVLGSAVVMLAIGFALILVKG
ncbi:MAG: hypothetical protein AAF532_06745 [Planctomycetota bacterium]